MLSFALLGAGWVLWLLVVLSVGVVAVSLERAFVLGRDGSDPAALGDAVNGFLAQGDTAAFRARLEQIPGMESRILRAGVEVGRLGPDAAGKAMTGTATAERLKMERGLAFIATVGANAPFVGLFGTVLGIIQAFQDLAKDTEEASTAVMAGISEALVATAVGLLVAIPAVVLYNSLSRWVKSRLGRSESLADLVLARLSGEGATDGS
ncbi:MAG: MotA/TolQ/ExbB proton channel family protein [Alphaproteobacteria bacterium]|nr:MotA/TolQ/ExbB proton channel family protein [Alphaproteobacteria bacterium]